MSLLLCHNFRFVLDSGRKTVYVVTLILCIDIARSGGKKKDDAWQHSAEERIVHRGLHNIHYNLRRLLIKSAVRGHAQ